MKKQRFGLSWLNLGLLVAGLTIAAGACTRAQSGDDDSGSNNNNNNTTTTGTGGAAPVTNTTTTTTTGKGGTTATTTTTSTTAKGGTTGTTTANSGTGNVTACDGIPATSQDTTGLASACNGTTVEAEPLPVDMIILMDRSISNSYAIGSDTATSATNGELTRWDVLKAAMQALASSDAAKNLGASITFFSITGGADETANCNATAYEKPIVPLGLLSQTGSQIVAAMDQLTPSGLTPTVPALTGAFRYAMAEKQKDSTREKVVVMISDGFPTQCTQKSPSDVANVIKEAAAAPIPIRTFIIGIGSPKTASSAKFNLINYASSGNTGKPPFVLDETAGAAGVQDQLVTALLNISSSSLACEYGVSAPSPDWIINPDEVMFTYQPNAGSLQEIPKVAGASTCAKSANGGWYFDNATAPTKITVCPCTCAAFGAGSATVVYGCKPNLVLE
jgi:hypothetical protein